MKCPKCQYIGYDEVERCRNCGYEFTLVKAADPIGDLDLSSRRPPEGPLADFMLADPQPPAPLLRQPLDPAEFDAFVPPPAPGRDLPLFQHDALALESAPLVAQRAVPRPPLSVRRATPDLVRIRPRTVLPARQPDLQPADLLATVAEDDRRAGEEPVSEPTVHTAVFGARLLAGAIDLLLLLAIDALVIYFTLRISGLDPAEARILPIVPLTAFFVLLNGGYFFTLTAAGGQTLGKMAMGVRVVAETGDPIPWRPRPSAPARISSRSSRPASACCSCSPVETAAPCTIASLTRA
jgi:hypothetical protein